MMRLSRLIATVFCIWIYAGCNPAKTPKNEEQVSLVSGKELNTHVNPDSAEKSIRQVMDEQAKAWNNADIDGFMQGYWHSDSLRFITKKGIRMGYDSVAAQYKKYYDTKDKMGRLNFSDLVITSLDNDHNIFNVTGKWEVIQKKETVGGHFSLLFRQHGGEWKIIIDHTW